MSKKHLIIKDADEDIEYDVEEVEEPVEEQVEEPVEEPVEEKVEEVASETHEEVCPECGKEPCECKPASETAVFTEEEIAALKELISIVPALKQLLEAKPEESPKEVGEVKEQEEIKEIEEVKEPEEIDEDEESDEIDEDEIDSVTDSVGSLEQTVGDGKADELNNTEATMAERFKKYYGGNHNE